MDVTLKVLNQSFEALKELCAQPLPKGQFQLARRLSRIKRKADTAINNWAEDTKTLGISYGFRIVGPGRIVPVNEGDEIKFETIEDYNKEADDIASKEVIHFRGEPFTEAELKEIEPHITWSPEMLNQLVWLFPDAEAEDDEPKTQAASA